MSNHKLKTTIIAVLFVMFLICHTKAYAEEYGFDTKQVEAEEMPQIWDNIAVREVTELKKAPITGFDVSESGDIAIVTTANEIAVYDKNGQSTKFYAFESSGMCYIGWNEENLVLFSIRSSIIYEFSSDIKLISMREIDEGSIRSVQAWEKIRHRTQLTKNNYTYKVKNDIGFLNLFSGYSYSILEKIDQSDNHMYRIYDVTEEQTVRVTTILSFFCILFVIGITVPTIVIVKNCKKRKSGKNGNTGDGSLC